MNSLYKTILLDHFHNPRHKGGLDTMDIIRRGSNPRCGDDIEVGIKYGERGAIAIRFRGRGCSICLASASMMCEKLTGLNRRQISQTIERIRHSLGGGDQTAIDSGLAALNVVRHYPARCKCALLAWRALDQTLRDASTVVSGCHSRD